MPWDGSGNFNRNHNWTDDAGAGIDIEASRMDSEDNNFKGGIEACLTKNGENAPTGDLPMAGRKHTNVGNGSARNHYPSIGQFQDSYGVYAGLTGGTGSAYTANLTPAITAYVAGLRLMFVAHAESLASPTISLNGLSAKSLFVGSRAVAAGELQIGQLYYAVYDGANFLVFPSVIPIEQFIQLTDTPASYQAGDAGKLVRVNSAEDGLEFSDQPAEVAAHMSGPVEQLSGSTGTISVCNMTAIIMNHGSIADTANNRFNISVDGVYKLGASVQWQINSGRVGLYFYKNGVQVASAEAVDDCSITSGSTPPDTRFIQKLSWLMDLANGDYVDLRMVQQATNNLRAYDRQFWIHKI